MFQPGILARRRRQATCGAVVIVWSLCVTSAALAANPSNLLTADPAAMAGAMQSYRIVLLGEVHDNPIQHELRAKALRILIENGARPALAFEQFDRERQSDIERARRERPRDADYLIAQAKSGAWDWSLYRPFVVLALDFDLPIVAANLSRKDAMRVATEGWAPIFDESARRTLQLDTLPDSVRLGHEDAIAEGHCQQLPASALPAMARAQIARDIVLAQALSTHANRGVVLLAGNGHVRRDLGVPLWLSDAARKSTLSMGLLERPIGDAQAAASQFDHVVETAATPRPDPCRDLALRSPALPASAPLK